MAQLVPLPLQLVEPAWAARVPSPAHDSMNAKERRAYLEVCPDSYFAVTRSIEDLPVGTEMTVNELLALGRDSLDLLISKGAFSDLREPAMYVYRLDDGRHAQAGILCGASTADFENGLIRAHERVFGAQRDHLAKHFEIVGSQSSPIVMAHPDNDAIDAIVASAMQQPPLLDFYVPDGLRQTIWTLEDSLSRTVTDLVSADPLYIIDGHHRTGAAQAYLFEAGPGSAEYMLTAIFPASQMRSLAFHRWLRSDDDCRWLFDAIREHFPTRTIGLEDVDNISGDELAIYHQGSWTAVELPNLPDGDALSRLDPVRLQRHLLGPHVGIDESAPRDRLDYVSDKTIDQLIELVDHASGALVLMRPVETNALFDVADAGQIMPPKSTYFMPKARSGVVLRPL